MKDVFVSIISASLLITALPAAMAAARSSLVPVSSFDLVSIDPHAVELQLRRGAGLTGAVGAAKDEASRLQAVTAS